MNSLLESMYDVVAKIITEVLDPTVNRLIEFCGFISPLDLSQNP